MEAVVVYAPMDFGLEQVSVPEVPEGGSLLALITCAPCAAAVKLH
jgi:hypothetical protein